MRRIAIALTVLSGGCGPDSWPGPPTRLADFEDGYANALLAWSDTDDDGVVDQVETLFQAYEPDGGCAEIAGDPQVSLDGLVLVQAHDGAFTGRDQFLVGAAECDGLPTWSWSGSASVFFEGAPESSAFLLTDGETEYAFSVPGFRRPPDLAWTGADPAALPPETEVRVTFGPEGMAVDTADAWAGQASLRFWQADGSGFVVYSVCPPELDCAIDAAIEGDTWTFTTPPFCREGVWGVGEPVRSIQVVCPDAFTDCDRSDEDAISDGFGAALWDGGGSKVQVAFPDGYTAPDCP